MPSVYIVKSNAQYHKMFIDRGWTMADDIKSADLVQFTGGEDVTPYLYNEPCSGRTYCNPNRDVKEMGIYHAALSDGKPMAGICRGGQFLHVMNGGKLRQHVEDHTSEHCIAIPCYNTSGNIKVSSTHHQQMIEGVGELLGWDTSGEEEIIYHKHTRSLCFQPHPELPGYGDCTDLYFCLLGVTMEK